MQPPPLIQLTPRSFTPHSAQEARLGLTLRDRRALFVRGLYKWRKDSHDSDEPSASALANRKARQKRLIPLDFASSPICPTCGQVHPWLPCNL